MRYYQVKISFCDIDNTNNKISKKDHKMLVFVQLKNTQITQPQNASKIFLLYVR